ncbi:unnamed protein product [Phytophthora lilii]|uniref:Unnamed protein product n=1 Tax=Phytophthora lilii TaxID=2077276 RepID=A0A9W7CJE9_9STRA|nr:unnamed protein product [Phytophthora lilii]
MAALPTVASAPSTSPPASNATTNAAAAAFGGRGSRLSRIARRSGAATSLTTGTPAASTVTNEKAMPSPDNEGDSKEQQVAPKSTAAAARAGKWSALRREILPSPALMTVSEKVQHIIE